MMLGKATANLLKIPLICKFFVIGAKDKKAGMLKSKGAPNAHPCFLRAENSADGHGAGEVACGHDVEFA